ncbi:[NU+] prion formation protein 1 [Knufia peltigerae]|uniref:[NU+] prion formation protein 1 n=1 Tax=Knufia peltigerae TaxID=1002370 RepID=A0AA38XD60_9EURO|nr:[NU+] prion formation protein 1 [Knufia peltigerae]
MSYANADRFVLLDEIQALRANGVLAQIKCPFTHKANRTWREPAMLALGAFFDRFLRSEALSEVVFLLEQDLVPLVLDAMADKDAAVREAAKYALLTLVDKLSPEALVVALLPILLDYIRKNTTKWQGIAEVFTLISQMARGAVIHASERAQILRKYVESRLEDLIPLVADAVLDLKPEVMFLNPLFLQIAGIIDSLQVSKRAKGALDSLLALIHNPDLVPCIPVLYAFIRDPSGANLRKAISTVSHTTFISSINSADLAVLLPLFERALSSPNATQDLLREALLIVENLTKLLQVPTQAVPFLKRLMHHVENASERAAIPEVQKSAKRLLGMMKDCTNPNKGQLHPNMTVSQALLVLEKAIRSCDGYFIPSTDTALSELTKRYVASLVTEVVNQQQFSRVTVCIEPYLDPIMKQGSASVVAERVQRFFSEADSARRGLLNRNERSEVEVVNTCVSLGYGTITLLSQTNLRLVKGRRYGLCGRNGAGKSTLIRSIAQGKLEGFPSPDQVRICYVCHEEDEDADLSVCDYMARGTREEDIAQISLALQDVNFGESAHLRVGSLSGGWKVKLALARAFMTPTDILLFDEPTNHLDRASVSWLQERLKSNTEVTSLLVSHDAEFLNEVCTDIYYIDGTKLVWHGGNFASFTKRNSSVGVDDGLPDGARQFQIPPPGLLTGLKSATRAILRMSHCTYTYPGASQPALSNASCQVSLSSRVAIVGPNGAGKSTLVKVLTEELIPQEGTVEKHPNLRVGYIRQHALEHVEMHEEKTPSQYLQWRYIYGDDREVLTKQTRIMTAEDKTQMQKMIHWEGKARQMEALVGRQKWKKSFQKWVGSLAKYNSYLPRETLIDLGFHKLVQRFNDHEASREGLGFRKLETEAISKHFHDVGLGTDVVFNTSIASLSDGQKAKVVLAGALWNNPHLLILDEPSNFLDGESLGALITALEDYKGGIVVISHSHDVLRRLCPGLWRINAGYLTCKGHLLNDDGCTSIPNRKMSKANSAGSGIEPEPELSRCFDAETARKKKLTRAQLKERTVRRRLRHIDWLNSPKGTPRPPDTDDEE